MTNCSTEAFSAPISQRNPSASPIPQCTPKPSPEYLEQGHPTNPAGGGSSVEQSLPWWFVGLPSELVGLTGWVFMLLHGLPVLHWAGGSPCVLSHPVASHAVSELKIILTAGARVCWTTRCCLQCPTQPSRGSWRRYSNASGCRSTRLHSLSSALLTGRRRHRDHPCPRNQLRPSPTAERCRRTWRWHSAATPHRQLGWVHGFD